jgi:molybdopterin-guanine dinucleotide biosynthesis protein A
LDIAHSLYESDGIVTNETRGTNQLPSSLPARYDAAVQENEYAPHSTAQSDVTAFILTGGKSTRMGEDKALLRLPSGSTFLEHSLAIAGAVAAEVGIVGPRQLYGSHAWAGEIIEDVFPDRGPLGGIHAALSFTQTEWNVFIAVDLPLVTTDLLRWIVAEARKSGKQVTVASADGGLHPLCGVYRRSFKDRAAQGLQEGRNKVAANFDPESLRILTEEEITAAAFSPRMFANVNTPEEFQRLMDVGK